MAKMFYTMDETKAALGRNEEGIKQLAREGRLREFRDGPRLMFKADQVDQLKGELGGGDVVNLTPGGDSGAPISLAGDSSGGSGVSLADSRKGDTAVGDALGGSFGGVPSPGKVSPTGGSGSGLLNLGGSGASGSGLSSGGTRGGITIFDVDDKEKVDPSAQTAISPGVQDQINLEGVGSGSGLLDLTRESDDTSLGAVFDELTPAGGAGRRGVSAMETQAGSDIGMAAIDRGTRTTLAAPIYVEAADAATTALGLASIVALIVVCFAGFILTATVLGYRPEILDTLARNGGMYLALAAGATVVVGIIGFFVGKK